jgi:hypothetical protein
MAYVAGALNEIALHYDRQADRLEKAGPRERGELAPPGGGNG